MGKSEFHHIELTGRCPKVYLMPPAVIDCQVFHLIHIQAFQGKIAQDGMTHLSSFKHVDILTVHLQFHADTLQFEEGEEIHHGHATDIGHLLCPTDDRAVHTDVAILLDTAHDGTIDTDIVVRLDTTDDGTVLADIAVLLDTALNRATNTDVTIRFKSAHNGTIDTDITIRLNLSYNTTALAKVVTHHTDIDCEQQGKCQYHSQKVILFHIS